MVPKIVEFVGLGIGFLLWCGSNLIVGYFVGKFGLFGVQKEVTVGTLNQVLNIVGIILAFASLLPNLFVKPTLSQIRHGNKRSSQTLDSNKRNSVLVEDGIIASDNHSLPTVEITPDQDHSDPSSALVHQDEDGHAVHHEGSALLVPGQEKSVNQQQDEAKPKP